MLLAELRESTSGRYAALQSYDTHGRTCEWTRPEIGKLPDNLHLNAT